MKGNRYLFMRTDGSKEIVDSMKLLNDKAAFQRAGQISKTTNEQIVVLRAIAIVDERPSATLMFENEETSQ